MTLTAWQVLYEQRAFWRNRARAFFAVGFPLLSYFPKRLHVLNQASTTRLCRNSAVGQRSPVRSESYNEN